MALIKSQLPLIPPRRPVTWQVALYTVYIVYSSDSHISLVLSVYTASVHLNMFQFALFLFKYLVHYLNVYSKIVPIYFSQQVILPEFSTHTEHFYKNCHQMHYLEPTCFCIIEVWIKLTSKTGFINSIKHLQTSWNCCTDPVGSQTLLYKTCN